jgi:uncharacterized RDD family membrane protein YckC
MLRKIFDGFLDFAALGFAQFAMACPLCGDRCTCSATGNPFAGEHTAVLIDPDSNYSSDATEGQFASSLDAPASAPHPVSRPLPRVAVAQTTVTTATATADPAFYRRTANGPDEMTEGAWRDEISLRVQAHKARRRRRFDPDASLPLGFAADTTAEEDTEVATPVLERAAPRMYRRIALEIEAQAAQARSEAADAYADAVAVEAAEAAAAAETNVIEFPRIAQTEDLFAAYELAEPIVDSPRILDVPEEAPLAANQAASSLSSLRLDDVSEGAEKDVPDWIRNYRDEYDEAELEMPLQVAPMRPRVVSAVIDSAMVLTATAVFCVIVLSITKFMPQGKAAVLTAICLSATLWLAYHFAFLVFCGMTPGMQVAQLELCSFEGCYPLRKTRGARAWAMGVSCMSLGMGFAWALVDEDGLGWHDRITRTYLRQS